MIDMLVRLYDLPESADLYERLRAQGIVLRRPGAYEKHIVADWAGNMFSPKWRSECEVAFTRRPVSCFIATKDKQLLAFACYETTCRGFFGPMGVAPDQRGTGLGKAVLMLALEAMRAEGHAYAIIGGVGPKDFYARTVGAIEIPGSDPGIYQDILPG